MKPLVPSCLAVAMAMGACATAPDAGSAAATLGRFRLFNPLQVARTEIVPLPLSANAARAGRLEAFDATAGKLLPVQQRAADDDAGHALIEIRMGAGERHEVVLRPAGDSAPPPSRAFGRHVPERMDDFAWENDRVAFRMYGPALAATGEVSSGIDVWAKRTHALVVDRWYAGEDYHADHGEGLDFYKVGPSRGCGGLARRVDGVDHVSGNYVRWRRLANGPLRVTFELDYAPWGASGSEVAETKRISLDAGSDFSLIRSRFAGEAAGLPVPGINGDGDPDADAGGRWIALWGKPDPAHGSIGCAIVLAQGKGRAEQRDGQRWLVPGEAPGREFAYYAGAAWSRGADIHGARAWERTVAAFARRIAAPIEVHAQEDDRD